MKVYEQAAESLSQLSVDTVFSLPGGANMYVPSAFEGAGSRFVRTRHEAGAIGMADTHAQLTGDLDTATVTHRPGFTNALTASVEASWASPPMLVIAGDTTAKFTHIRRLDVAALCAPVEVADALGTELFTSGLGVGLVTGHPHHLGITGNIEHEEATPMLMDSDCVIAVSESLTKWTSLGGEILDGKALIQIDGDLGEARLVRHCHTPHHLVF